MRGWSIVAEVRDRATEEMRKIPAKTHQREKSDYGDAAAVATKAYNSQWGHRAARNRTLKPVRSPSIKKGSLRKA